MKKHFVSLLLVVVVSASTFALLDSANPLSTVTKTYTSTYTTAMTKSTAIGTIYETYVLTSEMPIGPEYNDQRYDNGRTKIRVWFHMKAGDTIIIKAETPRDNSWADIGYGELSPPSPQVLAHFSFGSDQYEEKTYQAIKDGYYLVEFTMSGLHSNLPVSITAHRTAEHTVTSSNYVVEQYVTSFLAESTFTRTETITSSEPAYAGGFESQITIILFAAIIAVAIVIVLAKRKPKHEQTQLE